MLCRGALGKAVFRREARAIILLPVGGREGINQHGELTEDAGAEGPPGTGEERLLAADRDRFSL